MTDKEKDCTDCKHYYTDYDCREFCENRDMFEPNKKIKKMTNQKAIETLKNIKAGFETDEWLQDDVEALERAIKAIKKDAGCKYCKYKNLATFEIPCIHCYKKFKGWDKYEENKQ